MKTIEEVAVLLDEPLDNNLIQKNYQEQYYIPAHAVITAANRCFGYDGWGYEIKSFKDLGDGLYQAIVRVNVYLDGIERSSEDIGACIAAKQKGSGEISREGHETAIKGAVSDAMKRAFRKWGSQFGNDLYDKEYLSTLPAGTGTTYHTNQTVPQRQAPQRQAAPQQQSAGGWAPVTPKSKWRANGEQYAKYDISDIPNAPPACPKCGGDMWDNIASPYFKESGGLMRNGEPGPVFTCKNKECKKPNSKYTTAIYPDAYSNGNPGDAYYPTPEDNPYNYRGSGAIDPATVIPPAPSNNFVAPDFPPESFLIDMEDKAHSLWGATWKDELTKISTEVTGNGDVKVLSSADANKVMEKLEELIEFDVSTPFGGE